MDYRHMFLTDAEVSQALEDCSAFYLEVIELPLSIRTINSAQTFNLKQPPPAVLRCADHECEDGGICIGSLVVSTIRDKKRQLYQQPHKSFDNAEVFVCAGMSAKGSDERRLCDRQYQVRMWCKIENESATSQRLVANLRQG